MTTNLYTAGQKRGSLQLIMLCPKLPYCKSSPHTCLPTGLLLTTQTPTATRLRGDGSSESFLFLFLYFTCSCVFEAWQQTSCCPTSSHPFLDWQVANLQTLTILLHLVSCASSKLGSWVPNVLMHDSVLSFSILCHWRSCPIHLLPCYALRWGNQPTGIPALRAETRDHDLGLGCYLTIILVLDPELTV